ncbi:hypothetical protein [Cellulomonas sp. Marseille-Q8402]
MARHTPGSALGVLLVLSACSSASSPPPASWQEYDTLAALRDDASVVVSGVAQGRTGSDDGTLVDVSVTTTLAGTAPAEDPVRVRLDADAPLSLEPGFHYVLYLTADDAGGDFAVVGPGAFERPPGASRFSRAPGAPDTLPASVAEAELADE